MWFRLFGKLGLVIKNTKISGMSFSEREGLINFIIIRGWLIKSIKNYG